MRPSDSLKLVRNSHPESGSEVDDCVPTVGHAVYFMGDFNSEEFYGAIVCKNILH